VKIALFTPFSPEIGGGSAQLRHHLAFLSGLDIEWYYLADCPASRTDPAWKYLGGRFTPAEFLGDLVARTGFLPGSTARAKQLVERIQADRYWVVGHYEGISIAAELLKQGKPVQLTIHDDPFGTWLRSERYRWFRPLLRSVFPKVLCDASGVDMTSWGMRDLYRGKYNLRCFAVYLHVPALPVLQVAPDPARLSIGHIGTLYQAEPFRRFVEVCKKIAARQNRALRIVLIGAAPEMDQFARRDPDIFESHGNLDEADAIPLLAKCDLLYAMYPSGKKFEMFRRTSLPIKLSTYVQAQRPIFAHSPADSTLARIVAPYQVGLVCESKDEGAIERRVLETLSQRVGREFFERLRNELMGPEQVQQLGAALRGEDWSKYAECDFTGAN